MPGRQHQKINAGMQCRADSFHADLDFVFRTETCRSSISRAAKLGQWMLSAMKNTFHKPLIILCLAGSLLSFLSLHHHYSHSTSSYCNLDETFNCDLVNRSSYSVLFGVPVALIGAVGYMALLASSLLKTHLRIAILRLLMSTGGLGFALYLTYIEEHVLRTWCLLCIGSLFTILCITILSVLSLRKQLLYC
jgi:vitamin-K-epoxide reductase (warfarin-sensitive)